jgi:hypothetical protein
MSAAKLTSTTEKGVKKTFLRAAKSVAKPKQHGNGEAMLLLSSSRGHLDSAYFRAMLKRFLHLKENSVPLKSVNGACLAGILMRIFINSDDDWEESFSQRAPGTFALPFSLGTCTNKAYPF